MMKQYCTKLALVLFCLGSLQATDLTKQPSEKVKNEAVVQTTSAKPSSKILTNTPVPQECKILFDKLSEKEQKHVRTMYEANKKKKWKACLLAIFGGQALYLKSHRVAGLLTFICLVIAIGAKNTFTITIFTILCWLVEWCTLLFSQSIKDENARVFQQALERTTTYKQAVKEALPKFKDPMYAQVPRRSLPYLFALSEGGQQEALNLFKKQQTSLLIARCLSIFGCHGLYMNIKRSIVRSLLILVSIFFDILLYLVWSDRTKKQQPWWIFYTLTFTLILAWIIEQVTLQAHVQQINKNTILSQIAKAQANEGKATDLTKQPSDKVKNETVVQTTSAQPSSKALTNTPVPQECKILFDKLSDEEQKHVRATYEPNKKKKWKACLLAIFGGQGLYLKSHRVVGLLTFIFLFFGLILCNNAPNDHRKFIAEDCGGSLLILWLVSLVVEWCTLLFSHSIKNENIRLFQKALEETKTYKKALDKALAKAKDPMYAQVPQGCLPYVLALSDEAQQEAVGLFQTQQKSVSTARRLAWFGGHSLYMRYGVSEGIVMFIIIAWTICVLVNDLPRARHKTLNITGSQAGDYTNYLKGITCVHLIILGLAWFIVYTRLSATIEQVNTTILLKQMHKVQAAKTKSV